MSDYIVRATAANEAIRAFAITSREMVEEGRTRHNTSPVVTAALGRMLSAGSMMGVMLKGEDDLVTLQIQGAGPMKGITITSDSKGYVKGFPNVPVVDLPAKNGKLDVGGAIDFGVMRVIKDMGLKEPYVGTVELQTGEIAEDLTYYFAVSEQTPSSVGLGVLMNKDNTVNCAGGFIIQLMPFTPDEVIDQLEENLKTCSRRARHPSRCLRQFLRDLLSISRKHMMLHIDVTAPRKRLNAVLHLFPRLTWMKLSTMASRLRLDASSVTRHMSFLLTS